MTMRERAMDIREQDIWDWEHLTVDARRILVALHRHPTGDLSAWDRTRLSIYAGVPKARLLSALGEIHAHGALAEVMGSERGATILRSALIRHPGRFPTSPE